jgi:hypothetical protein
MSGAELQSTVKRLSRVEKLKLIQFIVSELAKQEKTATLKNSETYPIWSPYDAFEAADTLYNELKKENIHYGQ